MPTNSIYCVNCSHTTWLKSYKCSTRSVIESRQQSVRLYRNSHKSVPCENASSSAREGCSALKAYSRYRWRQTMPFVLSWCSIYQDNINVQHVASRWIYATLGKTYRSGIPPGLLTRSSLKMRNFHTARSWYRQYASDGGFDYRTIRCSRRYRHALSHEFLMNS